MVGSAADPPTPAPPAGTLADPYVRWVSRLVSRDVSPHTRAAYVSDVLTVGICFLDVLGRDHPPLLVDGAAAATAAERPAVTRLRDAGVRPLTYVRAHAVLAFLAPADLTVAHTEEAFAAHAAGRAPASRTRAVSAWNSFCRFLVRADLLPANPMERIDWDRARPRLPRPVDAQVLTDVLAAIRTPPPKAREAWPARDLALFATFVSTGVRLSEAIDATLASLQYWGTLTPLLRVLGKGRKPRVIRLADEAVALLQAYLDERTDRLGPPLRDDPLFVRTDGSRFTPAAVRRLVDGWYRRAGHSAPEGAVVHALRHTFATEAIRGGAPLPDLQEVLGHASLQTTAGYLKVLGQAGDRVIANHPAKDLLRGAGDDRSR